MKASAPRKSIMLASISRKQAVSAAEFDLVRAGRLADVDDAEVRLAFEMFAADLDDLFDG
ncbi:MULTISPECIES: hypothetical protein [unclassified Novosphingobium]|uniref:hypothetical protein n=1 Tax=unclassified Novosphingobium TaxID=2644732 RepID=UPI0013C2E838|nr:MULTISPECIES: hypothetical protein [unclassified Novosphingobium]